MCTTQHLLSEMKYSTYRMAAGTVVKTTYGYDIKSNEDSYNKLAIEAVSAVASLGLSGLTAVDLFPIRESCEHTMSIPLMCRILYPVRYVPTWFPGTSALERAKRTRILIDKMLDVPYQYVKSQRVSSIFSDWLLVPVHVYTHRNPVLTTQWLEL